MRLTFSLLLVVVCSKAYAQTAVPALSLTEAVRAALESHPALKAVASGRDVAEASLAEARTGRLPTVQAKGTLTQGNNPVYVFGSLLEQSRFGPANFSLEALNAPSSLTNLRSEILANLPVFDRRQTDFRVRQATIGVEQSDLQRREVEQQVRFEVIRAYFGLVAARSRADIAAASVRMAQEDLAQASARRDAGMTVESDVLSARLQQADFQQQQIQADAEIVSAAAALNVSMGRAVEAPVAEVAAIGDSAFAVRPLAELTDEALKQRPDYLRVTAAIRSADEGVSSTRSAALPRVDVFGSYGASTHHLWSGSSDYTAGASVSIDIFDAGRRARLDRARAALAVAAAEAEQFASRVRLEVVRARQELIAAGERLAVMRLTVEQSEEVHRVTQERYQAGLAAIAELLRTETAVVQARTNVIAARHAYRMAYAGLLLATGTLTDERVLADAPAVGRQ